MRSLLLSGAAALLLVAASVHEVVANTTGQTASPDPVEFVARVVGSTEDVWDALFEAMGHSPYPQPTVVIFSGKTRSECGLVSAAVGPRYCPADHKVYLDTASLSELSRRFGAPPSDFALAYLIVYEVSRHVQTALGTMSKIDEQMRQTDARGRNALSVRLELQADCYTGVWAYFMQKRNRLELGDFKVPAPQAVGESTPHADGAKRLWWFKRGLAAGDPQQCDTFVVAKP